MSLTTPEPVWLKWEKSADRFVTALDVKRLNLVESFTFKVLLAYGYNWFSSLHMVAELQ